MKEGFLFHGFRDNKWRFFFCCRQYPLSTFIRCVPVAALRSTTHTIQKFPVPEPRMGRLREYFLNFHFIRKYCRSQIFCTRIAITWTLLLRYRLHHFPTLEIILLYIEMIFCYSVLALYSNIKSPLNIRNSFCNIRKSAYFRNYILLFISCYKMWISYVAGAY